MTRQLALDLGHRAALGREDFLVSVCNEAAVDWLDRWPDWRAPGLFVWGEPASGKSHLGQVWCARAGARSLSARELDQLDVAATVARSPRLFVDDADAAAGVRDREETLLHLYNHALEEGGTVLLAAVAPPARWTISIADLASRLRALPAVEIGAPDDALLAAVLVKHFSDRQLQVGEGVIAYLLARMERSFAAAARMVADIDRRALEGRRPVTVPLVREVIESPR